MRSWPAQNALTRCSGSERPLMMQTQRPGVVSKKSRSRSRSCSSCETGCEKELRRFVFRTHSIGHRIELLWPIERKHEESALLKDLRKDVDAMSREDSLRHEYEA